MHKYLVLLYNNDENGNKLKNVEPQYFYLDDEMKVRETYKRYRNVYNTKINPETGEEETLATRKYTLELCKGMYQKMTTSDADAWVDSLIKNA